MERKDPQDCKETNHGDDQDLRVKKDLWDLAGPTVARDQLAHQDTQVRMVSWVYKDHRVPLVHLGQLPEMVWLED